MKKLLINVTLLLFAIHTTTAQIITTIAGGITSGYSGDGGPATAAKLNDPIGLVLDATGNLYIADYLNERVRKIDNSGIITTIAGNGTTGFYGDGGPATSAELNNPADISMDASGNLYIIDRFNYRVRMVNTNGIISTYAGNGVQGYAGDGGPATAAEFWDIDDIVVDTHNNVFITDAGNIRVRVVNTNGIISTYAGNGTYSYSGDGGPATAAEIKDPEGLAIDAAGNLYIADFFNERVRVVNSSGIISTFAGTGIQGFSGDGGPATAADLYYPSYVRNDASGNLYISEEGNYRVRGVSWNGTIVTVAGNGNPGYSGDGGPATQAAIGYPGGIAIDPSGNIYLAVENGIRYITTPLTINNIDQQITNVLIYPNPSRGIFTVQSSLRGTKQSLEIYNILGEKVLTQPLSPNGEETQIDLNDKPSGVYLYKIITEKGEFVGSGKLIKQ